MICNNPDLNKRSKPTEGFGDAMILFNSSVIRSCEIMRIRSASG
jgi:hypothetical protein